MRNINEIKNRIKTIRDTEQITRAMKLISVSKMRKAIIKYRNNLTYAKIVRKTMKDILVHSPELSSKYIKLRPGKRITYVVVAGNKGLAGGYNANVLNLAYAKMQEAEEPLIFAVGQVAKEFFEKKGIPIHSEYLNIANEPTLGDVRGLTLDLLELYDKKQTDEIVFVYTKLISPTVTEAVAAEILPVRPEALSEVDANDRSYGIAYDASPNEVLQVLIPQYVLGMVYGAMVQASASEHSSRMIAMENATDNADKMLKELSLEYNRARQENITNELNEIVAASVRKA